LKSSARSALIEGLDSSTLVLIHPEVKLGYRSHARSVQARESLRVANLSVISKTAATGVRRVERFSDIWKYLKVSTRSACKDPL
jgi:hypothetical protein